MAEKQEQLKTESKKPEETLETAEEFGLERPIREMEEETEAEVKTIQDKAKDGGEEVEYLAEEAGAVGKAEEGEFERCTDQIDKAVEEESEAETDGAAEKIKQAHEQGLELGRAKKGELTKPEIEAVQAELVQGISDKELAKDIALSLYEGLRQADMESAKAAESGAAKEPEEKKKEKTHEGQNKLNALCIEASNAAYEIGQKIAQGDKEAEEALENEKASFLQKAKDLTEQFPELEAEQEVLQDFSEGLGDGKYEQTKEPEEPKEEPKAVEPETKPEETLKTNKERLAEIEQRLKRPDSLKFDELSPLNEEYEALTKERKKIRDMMEDGLSQEEAGETNMGLETPDQQKQNYEQRLQELEAEKETILNQKEGERDVRRLREVNGKIMNIKESLGYFKEGEETSQEGITGKSTEALRAIGYIDIPPQEILEMLKDDEAKIQEYLENENFEGLQEFLQEKIKHVLEGKGELGQEEIENISQKIAGKIDKGALAQAYAEMEKSFWQSFREQGVKGVGQRAKNIWAKAKTIGLKNIGRMSAKMGLTMGAATAGSIGAAALISVAAAPFLVGGAGATAAVLGARYGIKKFLEPRWKKSREEEEQKRKESGKESALEEAIGSEKKNILSGGAFIDSERLSALISNEVRISTNESARSAIEDYTEAMEQGDMDKFQEVEGYVTEQEYKNALHLIRGTKEYKDLPLEAQKQMALTIALTLHQDAKSEALLSEEAETAPPGKKSIVQKFIEIRTGERAMEAKGKEKLGFYGIAIGLGIGTSALIRGTAWGRSITGAVGGGVAGYSYAERKEARGDINMVKKIEALIRDAENKIQDIIEGNGDLNELKDDMTTIKARLDQGLLEAYPTIKSRAENFVYRVRQLEIQEKEKPQAFEELLNELHKDSDKIEEKIEADKAAIKKAGLVKKIGYTGAGMAAGALVGYLGAEWAEHRQEARMEGQLEEAMDKIGIGFDENGVRKAEGVIMVERAEFLKSLKNIDIQETTGDGNITAEDADMDQLKQLANAVGEDGAINSEDLMGVWRTNKTLELRNQLRDALKDLSPEQRAEALKQMGITDTTSEGEVTAEDAGLRRLQEIAGEDGKISEEDIESFREKVIRGEVASEDEESLVGTPALEDKPEFIDIPVKEGETIKISPDQLKNATVTKENNSIESVFQEQLKADQELAKKLYEQSYKGETFPQEGLNDKQIGALAHRLAERNTYAKGAESITWVKEPGKVAYVLDQEGNAIECDPNTGEVIGDVGGEGGELEAHEMEPIESKKAELDEESLARVRPRQPEKIANIEKELGDDLRTRLGRRHPTNDWLEGKLAEGSDPEQQLKNLANEYKNFDEAIDRMDSNFVDKKVGDMTVEDFLNAKKITGDNAYGVNIPVKQADLEQVQNSPFFKGGIENLSDEEKTMTMSEFLGNRLERAVSETVQKAANFDETEAKVFMQYLAGKDGHLTLKELGNPAELNEKVNEFMNTALDKTTNDVYNRSLDVGKNWETRCQGERGFFGVRENKGVYEVDLNGDGVVDKTFVKAQKYDLLMEMMDKDKRASFVVNEVPVVNAKGEVVLRSLPKGMEVNYGRFRGLKNGEQLFGRFIQADKETQEELAEALIRQETSADEETGSIFPNFKGDKESVFEVDNSIPPEEVLKIKELMGDAGRYGDSDKVLITPRTDRNGYNVDIIGEKRENGHQPIAKYILREGEGFTPRRISVTFENDIIFEDQKRIRAALNLREDLPDDTPIQVTQKAPGIYNIDTDKDGQPDFILEQKGDDMKIEKAG
ncbi:hypothetical protein KKD19_02010 [Patescibacteria group bacterium]|nr:hypothetical protein [Patescibacteria group bacterium]